MIHNYQKLEVWNKATDFAVEVCRITKQFPQEEKFGLVSQVNRAVISIPSNIAEGKMRDSDTEFRRFLLISLSSGAELETQFIIAKRLGYIEEIMYNKMAQKLSEIMKMLNGLITKLEASRNK